MMRFVKILAVFAFSASCIFLTGCSNEKRVAVGKPLRAKDPASILKHVEKESLNWDWLGLKIDADIKSQGGSESVTLNVRIARDSAIWISISPALGVELIRLLLLPDTVQVICKVPQNKFVFKGDYQQLEDELGIPFDFYTFQALFSGYSIGLDPDNDKFISKVDGPNYVLIGKFPRRVKKLMGGIDERGIALNPDDSLAVTLRRRQAQRVLNRTDEEDLIIKRYWFDGISFAPVLDVFTDIESGLTIRIERSGDEDHRQGLLPTKTKLTAHGKGVDINATFNIRRSRVNKVYELPFDPPEGYEQRESL